MCSTRFLFLVRSFSVAFFSLCPTTSRAPFYWCFDAAFHYLVLDRVGYSCLQILVQRIILALLGFLDDFPNYVKLDPILRTLYFSP